MAQLYALLYSLCFVDNLSLGVKEGEMAPLVESIGCIGRAHVVDLYRHTGHAILEVLLISLLDICTCAVCVCVCVCVCMCVCVCVCVCVCEQVCVSVGV